MLFLSHFYPTFTAAGKRTTMKDRILQLISTNRLEDAFLFLNTFGIKTVLLEAKFKRLKRDQLMGLLLQSQYNDRHEEICQELLNLAEGTDLGNGDKHVDDNPDQSGPST